MKIDGNSTPTNAWYVKNGDKPIKAHRTNQNSPEGGKIIAILNSSTVALTMSEEKFKTTYDRCFKNGEVITKQSVSPHIQALALIAANDKITVELETLKSKSNKIFQSPIQWVKNKRKSTELMMATEEISEHLRSLKQSVAA